MTEHARWWEELYQPPFESVMRRARSDEEMDRIAAFLCDVLHLGKGDRVFDQCCGTGRVAQGLAARDVGVVGVDQSATSIARAREEAMSSGLDMEFALGDAFEWRPEKPCDGAYNWWTAFANTPSDTRNEAMLHRAFEALRPGGRFALDYFNLAFLFRHFIETRVAEVATEEGDFMVIEQNRLDLVEGALRPTWTLIWPDGRRKVQPGYIRLYQPRELTQMMSDAGFTSFDFYGGPDGSSLSADSPRCIVVGRRP